MIADPEVTILRELRATLAARVAAGGLTPFAALQRLWAAVDAYNQRRHPLVRRWQLSQYRGY